MGIRFRKSISIVPGVRINLSKSGPSLSVGKPGATLNIGRRGTRTTVGAPGTGISYTTERSWGTLAGSAKPGGKQPQASTTAKRTSAPRVAFPGAPPQAKPSAALSNLPAMPDATKLELSFFQRLNTADDEEALIDACKELALGDAVQAFVKMQRATHLPDGAYLAGLLALSQGQAADAANYLSAALEQVGALGKVLAKHGITAAAAIAIAEETDAVITPTREGVMLALAEAYQASNQPILAVDVLRQLSALRPADPLVRLSLADAMADAQPGGNYAQELLDLTADIENDSDYHALLLLYRAQAMAALGMHSGARDLLTTTLRRTKDRSPHVLAALRYQRALTYEQLGQAKEYRADLERVFATDPDFEDTRQRLGLA